jgi:hypothetical protein
MSYPAFAFREAPLSEDALYHYPDAGEQLVLTAVRTWFRPRCDAVRQGQLWRDLLSEAGLDAAGIDCFDMMMHALLHASHRPLDTRCRCASDVASDEASLLQTLAYLQLTDSSAATDLLNHWLPSASIGHTLKFLRWFAVNLLNAGIAIPARARRVTYVH